MNDYKNVHYCVFTFALTLVLVMASSLPTFAAENNGEKSGVLRLISGVKSFIDSSAVKGVDPNYITAPEQPWQIILKGNVNQSDLQMKATIDGAELFGPSVGEIFWGPRIKTDPSTYIGLWAGYRGYGFGYFKNVGGDNGTYLTFGATGGSYGVNVRVHHFDTDEPVIHFKTTVDGVSYDIKDRATIDEPITVHTVIADAYYLFNGKHFSYAAAYDQSVIQSRSAGSLMAGAMFYHLNIDYAKDKNALFINLMNDIGRFKQWQGGIGLGYAYNFVPVKGLLISAMAMPILAFYNRSTSYQYDSELNDVIDLDNLESYDEEEILNNIRVIQIGKSSKANKISLNVDARLSVVYNWKRMFFNVSGQFNHFRYDKDAYSGWLSDWFVNASLGIRL